MSALTPRNSIMLAGQIMALARQIDCAALEAFYEDAPADFRYALACRHAVSLARVINESVAERIVIEHIGVYAADGSLRIETRGLESLERTVNDLVGWMWGPVVV